MAGSDRSFGGRVAPERDDVSDADGPVGIDDLMGLPAARADRCQVSGYRDRDLGSERRHRPERPVPARTSRTVGHADEGRVEACELTGDLQQVVRRLVAHRREELERDVDAHATTRRGTDGASGRCVATQIVTVSAGGSESGKSRGVIATSRSPAVSHHVFTSSSVKPSRRWP